MYKMTPEEQKLWDTSISQDPIYFNKYIAIRKNKEWPGGYNGVLKFGCLWKNFVEKNHDIYTPIPLVIVL